MCFFVVALSEIKVALRNNTYLFLDINLFINPLNMSFINVNILSGNTSDPSWDLYGQFMNPSL